MRLNIMCVDDERIANVNLKYDLKLKEGVDSIITFESPKLSLEYAKKHIKDNTINVAFLDINMPEMSGIQLAVELKKLLPGILIVFLSGEMIQLEEVHEVNAIGYLYKPYMQEELEEVLMLIRGMRRR